MQMQEQVEICNVMKNMFLPQTQRDPIVQRLVLLIRLQIGHMEAVEEVQEVQHDLLRQVDQVVLHQAEALALVEVAVVLHHQAGPQHKNNLKSLL